MDITRRERNPAEGNRPCSDGSFLCRACLYAVTMLAGDDDDVAARCLSGESLDGRRWRKWRAAAEYVGRHRSRSHSYAPVRRYALAKRQMLERVIVRADDAVVCRHSSTVQHGVLSLTGKTQGPELSRRLSQQNIPGRAMSAKCNVLFLCRANSARSVMAEALLRELGAGRFQAFCAGIEPAQNVHPLTLEQLRPNIAHLGNFRPKSWGVYATADARAMDVVICRTYRQYEF